MLRRTALSTWMIVSCLCVLTGASLAQPRPPGGAPWNAPGGHDRGEFEGPPPGPPGLRPLPLETLGLTDSQRRQIETLQDDAMRTMIRAGAEARIAEMDLEQMLDADRPDTVALTRQVERIAAIRASMLQSRVTTQVAVRALLTPQQRVKLRAAHAAGPQRPPR